MSTDLTTGQLEEMCAVAEKAARAGGDVALRGFRGPMEIRAKGYKDIVTQFDTQAEEHALSVIQARFPEHGIIAEESGRSNKDAEFVWAVDPIDGTHNYAAQLPFWCTSVAVISTSLRQVVVGVVYDALHGECFSGWAGGGANLNGERIHTSDVADLGEALLCTDIGYGAEVAHRMTSLAPWVQRHVRRYRLMGSAVLSMVYVAAGRFDGYYHLSLQPWDIAAASLLVTEAGGTLTDWEGQPIGEKIAEGPTSAIVATPAIHSALVEMLHKGETRLAELPPLF